MSVPEDQPHTRTRYPAGDAPPDAAPGRRPLRTLALVLAAVVALLVVVAVVNRTSGSSTPSGAAAGSGGASGNGGSGSGSGANASATAPTGANPVTTSQDGIATGFPDTSEGAQSAAVNYSVALGSSEMYATDSRHAIVATVADPADQSALHRTDRTRLHSSASKLGLVNGARAGRADLRLTNHSRRAPRSTATATTMQRWKCGRLAWSAWPAGLHQPGDSNTGSPSPSSFTGPTATGRSPPSAKRTARRQCPEARRPPAPTTSPTL